MKKIFKISCLILCFLIIISIGYTLANILNNNDEVENNSELIYYLNVKFDGIDISGNVSSDASISEINSSIIYVEDKIPEGLNFTGFSTTDNSSIGAVERGNSNISCLGSVIDDTNETGNNGMWINNNQEFIYHGLHYDAQNRTVSFKVENLKAGCVLTVGIKTTTPKTIDDENTTIIEKRRDFYNVAYIRENVLTTFSNIVHVFIGKTDEPLYTVTYEYASGTSENAPALPPVTSYSTGSKVNVLNDLFFEGYVFNGWTSNDVTITNGQFEMPNHNIVLTGSFTPLVAHNVTYSLTGTTPSEYELPITKEYYPNSRVSVDSLKPGDIINGYTFNGWTSNDVTITNGQFEMPNSDISINGSFSQIAYDVSYHFQGEVIPPNSESLLPATRTYAPGTTVTLNTVTEPNGYKFLGWYKENNFQMPNSDVSIYGEWKRFNGVFKPSINISDITGENYYKLGDKIRYQITVTNNEEYPIYDIILKENLSGAKFVSGNGYTVSSTMAIIDEIEANSSFSVYAEYIVKSSDSTTITNSVNIKGGSADNYYELKNQDYNTSITSHIKPILNICAHITGVDVGNSFKFKIYNNDVEYSTVLKNQECMNFYLDPGTYNIKEIVPQEYNIDSINGSISANDGNLTIVLGTNYQVTFNNNFKSMKFMHAFGNISGLIEGGNQ